jgi:hypothetical protein
VPADEIAEWRAAFLLFLKKLTWKYHRPLILKSPPPTARIRLLLEMFPGAKFVHIHRNPFVVFQSTRKTFRTMFNWQGLQRPDFADLDDWILDQYRDMYGVFFEERKAIPRDCYHELAFEDLERDPIGELRKLYDGLGLPDFRIVESQMLQYTASLHGYQKNQFPDLQPELKARIAESWRPSFVEWGY